MFQFIFFNDCNWKWIFFSIFILHFPFIVFFKNFNDWLRPEKVVIIFEFFVFKIFQYERLGILRSQIFRIIVEHDIEEDLQFRFVKCFFQICIIFIVIFIKKKKITLIVNTLFSYGSVNLVKFNYFYTT